MRREARGFTLIETLVALGIVAVALVALMGRLGASADAARTLAHQRAALDVAANALARVLEQGAPPAEERHGDARMGKETVRWRVWTEKTVLDGFVRVNAAAAAPGEPEARLFLYMSAQ